MFRNKFLLIVLATASLTSAAQSAKAQASRTWVSGVGNDANPCSRTAPCKTFAGAISKTAPAGEISVLDPGGYGAVTITKSITIDGGGGQVASVLAAGTNGIIVSAGAGQTVTLRNLRINGLLGAPVAGLNGIQFLTGAALHIENCTIFGFAQNGININLNSSSDTRVFVTDTAVTHSAGGIAIRNVGAGHLSLSMQRTSLVQNSSFGLKADGVGGTARIIGAVSDSLFAGNGTGVLAVGGTQGGTAIHVTRSTVVNNTTAGMQSDGTAGPAFIFSSDTLISGNGTGLSSVGGGNLLSFKNNSVGGNIANDGAFTIPLNPQ
jgi:hypothetical protein